MKVVLDTSTLIAAHISRAGVCAELMEDALLSHELVVSEFILEELQRKLREKFGFPDADVREVAEFLRAAATSVIPTELPPDSCRDTDDIPVLGTAIAGQADLLVSVDRDLLELVTFRGIAIVKPRDFWERTAQ